MCVCVTLVSVMCGLFMRDSVCGVHGVSECGVCVCWGRAGLGGWLAKRARVHRFNSPHSVPTPSQALRVQR